VAGVNSHGTTTEIEVQPVSKLHPGHINDPNI
jgi:hypothetical protein